MTARLILRMLWPNPRRMRCERRQAQVLPARQSIAAVYVVAAAFSIFLFCALRARRPKAHPRCEEVAELSVLASPVAPWRGAPLRVLFAAEKPMEGELSLISPDGRVAANIA